MNFRKLDQMIYNERIQPDLNGILPNNPSEEIWERIQETLQTRQQPRYGALEVLRRMVNPGRRVGLTLALSMSILFLAVFGGAKEVIMYKETNSYINDLVQSTYSEEPLVEDGTLLGTF